MDEINWRSAARKAESQQGGSFGCKTSTQKNDKQRKSRTDNHHVNGEAGSGFVRNEKFNNSHHNKWNRSHGDNFGSQSCDSAMPNTDLIHVETEYAGYVHAVKLGREGGLFCMFGPNDASSFTNKGFVPKILFNNKEKRLFQRGDKVQVRCTSKDPSLELSLAPEYVRPLLILDINGPLGERESYSESEPTKRRSFAKRNHLQEFLAFVSAHFEVAVWSCSTRHNLELSIFHGVNLLFVWCQEDSTSLYPRTSFISPAKPLFLKEIQKVWRKYPSFSAANTLLLDNHLEKFERNPYGTGIIVPDQQQQPGAGEDAVLAPGGELCSHLLAMCSERPLDIAAHVSRLGGSSPLFPAEYPCPPALQDAAAVLGSVALEPSEPSSAEQHEHEQHAQDIQQQVQVQEQEQEQEQHQQGQEQPELQQQQCPTNNVSHVGPSLVPSDDVLAKEYVFAVCNNNAKVTNVHITKRSLPGPKTTALHRKDIVDVASPQYVVCEKTDGERIILVINPKHGVVYFVRRNLGVELLTLSSERNQWELSDWARGLAGLTVLDGELIEEHGAAHKRAFLCFDAVIVNGDFVGKSRNVTLLERTAKAEEFLAKSPLCNFAFSASPLIFKCKEFTPVSRIADVIARLTHLCSSAEQEQGQEQGQGKGQGGGQSPEFAGWVYDLQPPVATRHPPAVHFPHLSDGLVFTPVNQTYYDYIAFKWKPAHMCTVDFSVSLRDVSNALKRKPKVFSVSGSVLSHNDAMIPLNEVWMSHRQGSDILKSKSSSPTIVVECAFIGQISRWELKKVRFDRPVPNSLRTAWSNLEVVAEAITLEGIVDCIGQHAPAHFHANAHAEGSLGSAGLVADVSKHYDQVQASRQTGFREERIAVHRKVMNWAKACLFKTAVFLSHSQSSQSDAALVSALRQQQADYSGGNVCFPNLNKPENKSKKIATKQTDLKAINVLDIACGRGGDIQKFTSDSSVEVYVGIDISPEQLKDCEKRAQHNRKVRQCITCLGDACTGTWRQVVARATGLPSASAQFDVAWCMFALHYFCDAEERLGQLLLHVADALRVGGKFACTFPNPFNIHDQLRRGGAALAQNGSDGEDKIYKVESDDSSGEQPFALSLDDCLRTFGHAYQFSLGDAVQHCKEFIVPFERVLEMAAEVGLRVSSLDGGRSGSGDRTAPGVPLPLALSMNSWVSDTCLGAPDFDRLRKVMGVTGARTAGRNLSGEEWEAISLYMCVVWTKMA